MCLFGLSTSLVLFDSRRFFVLRIVTAQRMMLQQDREPCDSRSLEHHTVQKWGRFSPSHSPADQASSACLTTVLSMPVCSRERQSTRCVDVECLQMSHPEKGRHLALEFIDRLICIRCGQGEKDEVIEGGDCLNMRTVASYLPRISHSRPFESNL
jgi:hypothetical protein